MHQTQYQHPQQPQHPQRHRASIIKLSAAAAATAVATAATAATAKHCAQSENSACDLANASASASPSPNLYTSASAIPHTSANAIPHTSASAYANTLANAFAIAVNHAIHKHPRVDIALQNWAAWATSADQHKPRLHPSTLARITTSPPAEDDEPKPCIDEKAAHQIDDILKLPAFTLAQRKLIRNLYQTTTTDHQLAQILSMPESAVLQMIDEALGFIGKRI